MGSAATIAPPQTVVYDQGSAGRGRRRGMRAAAPPPRRAWLADAGVLAGLLVVTCWVGVRSTAFAGVPKGGDALDHAATTQLLMENFPHLLWNYAWFGGMPSEPVASPELLRLRRWAARPPAARPARATATTAATRVPAAAGPPGPRS